MKQNQNYLPIAIGVIILTVIGASIAYWSQMNIVRVVRDEENLTRQEVKNQKTQLRKDIAPMKDEKQEETKIDTSNWKMCRSNKYGYEFKYPETWSIHIPVNRTITNCEDQTSLVLWSNHPGESLQRVTLSVSVDGVSFEKFMSTKDQSLTITKTTEIDGNKAVIFDQETERVSIKGLKVFSNGTNYYIGTERLPSDALFEALIESFEFKH